MTIRAWRGIYGPTPGRTSPKEANFQVGQHTGDRWVGTEINVSAPHYLNNYGENMMGQYTNFPRGGKHSPELFRYEPGNVTDMYTDVRAKHTAGVAMGLAATWHRDQGAERGPGHEHGMPMPSSNLSTDSAPIARKLQSRGIIPTNPANPETEADNELGKGGTRYNPHHEISLAPGDVELSAHEMRRGRETLREVFGKKRTAEIQPHPQKSNGEQLKLL